MTATPQTIATCHNPDWAFASTAAWTAPQPKNTRMNVPSASARQRAPSDGVGCPMKQDLCGVRPVGARRKYSNLGENNGKAPRCRLADRGEECGGARLVTGGEVEADDPCGLGRLMKPSGRRTAGVSRLVRWGAPETLWQAGRLHQLTRRKLFNGASSLQRFSYVSSKKNQPFENALLDPGGNKCLG